MRPLVVKKWLEDLVPHGLGYTTTVVRDRKRHPFTLNGITTDLAMVTRCSVGRHLDLDSAHLLHGIPDIDAEIENDLLHLHGITFDDIRPALEREFKFDGRSHERAHHLQAVTHRAAQILRRRRLHLGSTAEQEKLPDQLPGALGTLLELFQIITNA